MITDQRYAQVILAVHILISPRGSPHVDLNVSIYAIWPLLWNIPLRNYASMSTSLSPCGPQLPGDASHIPYRFAVLSRIRYCIQLFLGAPYSTMNGQMTLIDYIESQVGYDATYLILRYAAPNSLTHLYAFQVLHRGAIFLSDELFEWNGDTFENRLQHGEMNPAESPEFYNNKRRKLE